MWFVHYTVDLISLIENTIFRHMCADDAQVYDHCLPAAVDVFSRTILDCTNDVASWMRSNRLQINSKTTEVLWWTIVMLHLS